MPIHPFSFTKCKLVPHTMHPTALSVISVTWRSNKFVIVLSNNYAGSSSKSQLTSITALPVAESISIKTLAVLGRLTGCARDARTATPQILITIPKIRERSRAEEDESAAPTKTS
jgi:hypothetical protein